MQAILSPGTLSSASSYPIADGTRGVWTVENMSVRESTWRSWLVWGVALFAYAVALFQRTSLSVAVGLATMRFGIGASVFSTFVVVQLITYAGLQVPVGVLLDRFGPRLMIGTGGLVMAGGQVVLSLADTTPMAFLARILVGLGDAMTFISVLRLIPAWFPSRRVPLVTQLTGQVGQVGQIGSAVPLVAALAGPGWTAAYLGAAAVGVLTAITVFLAIRNKPAGEPRSSPQSWRQAGHDLNSSIHEPGTRLGLWTHFTGQFSGMVFALLWGYPFMTMGLGYSPALAGGLLSVMVVAATLIGPTLGQLTARYPMRRSNLIFGVVAATIVMWTVILVWPGRAPLPLFILLILVLAAYGPASALGFDFARTFNPAERLGSANGIVNVGGFVASLVTIFAIGVILDLQSSGSVYTLREFKIAFAFQYVLWAFGLVSIARARRLARAQLRAEGATIDPLKTAIVRHWRDRGRD
jgi:nitrate/nitrite transporter NarK